MRYILMKKAYIFISILLVLFGVFFAIAYHLNKTKVMIIGLDGADWRFIKPLVKEGKLPNFEKLLKNSAYGYLKTAKPTKSAILWTSISTGKRMEKHGIVDWTYVDNSAKEKIQRVKLITGKERTAATIWEILGEKGYSVGVINWWVTYPATKVNGFLISDRLRNVIFNPSIIDEKNLVYPESMIPELKPYVVTKNDVIRVMQKHNFPFYNYEMVDKFYSPSRFFKNMFVQIPSYIAHDDMAANWSLHMLKKKQPDFFAVVLRITDVYAHLAWRFIDKEYLEEVVPKIGLDSILSEDENIRKEAMKLIGDLDRKYADVLYPAYKFADDFIGEVMKIMDKDTVMIIISDHGFQWNGGGYDHNPMFGKKYPDEPPKGILIIYGKDVIPKQINDASIYSICPTVLYALNEPVAKDMDGEPIKDVFRNSFFAMRRGKIINTYGVGPVSDKAMPTDAAEKEVLEDLRSLGYIK